MSGVKYCKHNQGMIRRVSASILWLMGAGLSGCVSTPSELVAGGPVMVSEYVPEPVPYRVYTPPSWNGTDPLPLLIFLHDRNGHCTDLETAQIIPYLRTAFQSGEMPPCIIAAPESRRGFWWNYYDNTRRYADFLIADFIPRLRLKYPVTPGPGGLHILGVGTGAMGAVELAIQHPGHIGTVGALGGYFFDDLGAAVYVDKNIFSGMEKVLGPSTDPEAMRAHSVYHRIQSKADAAGTCFVLGSGAFSGWDVAESNELFRQHLALHNIPHDYVMFHGTSKWESRRNIMPVFIGLQLGDRRNRGQVNGMPYEVLKYR